MQHYRCKRDRLAKALEGANLKPIIPDGGIFIMANTSTLDVPASHMAAKTEACPVMTRDWALCRWLTIEKGITGNEKILLKTTII